jgi:hypothetical protein
VTKAAECPISATKSGMGRYSRVLLETVLSPQSIMAGEEGLPFDLYTLILFEPEFET